MELVGQIFGWLTALLTFLSFQCKEHKVLMIFNTAATLSICISYTLLGAWSGLVVNVVALARNFIISKKDLKIFSYKFWPYVLTITMGLMGLLSWQGYMSLIIIIAMMINTYFLCFPNTQALRITVLFTSIMVLIYNAYFGVWGGVLNEAIAITSAVIGIIRFRKTKVQRNEF